MRSPRLADRPLTEPQPDRESTKGWVSWSSGKDSAFSLHQARQDPDLEVAGLLVTFNADAGRVAMHGVRRELVAGQAQRLGLPVHEVDLPWPCTNAIYEDKMHAAMVAATDAGVQRLVFGDLFLADVRAYRESALASTGIKPVFPLWGQPTDRLAHRMLEAGVRAVVTCVDPAQLSADFVGRCYDEQFLADLPPGVDPCGENGEFHTFVWDGPGFSAPIGIEIGEVVERDGLVFCDLLPAPRQRRSRG